MSHLFKPRHSMRDGQADPGAAYILVSDGRPLTPGLGACRMIILQAPAMKLPPRAMLDDHRTHEHECVRCHLVTDEVGMAFGMDDLPCDVVLDHWAVIEVMES